MITRKEIKEWLDCTRDANYSFEALIELFLKATEYLEWFLKQGE